MPSPKVSLEELKPRECARCGGTDGVIVGCMSDVLVHRDIRICDDRRAQDTEARRCALCGRTGARGFMWASATRRWICRSDAACERRVRATGSVGVGVMQGAK